MAKKNSRNALESRSEIIGRLRGTFRRLFTVVWVDRAYPFENIMAEGWVQTLRDWDGLDAEVRRDFEVVREDLLRVNTFRDPASCAGFTNRTACEVLLHISNVSQPLAPKLADRPANMDDETWMKVMGYLNIKIGPWRSPPDQSEWTRLQYRIENEIDTLAAEERKASNRKKTGRPASKWVEIRRKFAMPLREADKEKWTYSAIYDAYQKENPGDRSASPDTIRHACERAKERQNRRK